MPKFLNLVSQSGKQEFVDIKDFNKNPNAYGKYKIRMVDDSTGKNFDIPATMLQQAQQDGLRPWNMEKTATAKPQPTTSQPSSRNVAPTPSYQDLISGDYWSKQLGAKPKQDILPTQNKVGLDLPDFGKQDEYVNRTADVLYNEQQKFAKSEEDAKRIQAQLTEANKRAEALKKQIAQERTTSYTPYGIQVGQINTDSATAKKLEQEQNVIAKLSAQLNENEYFKRNLSRLEGVASDLESQASKEILAQEQNQSWLSALTTGRDVMRGTYGIQHNEKMNQASAIRENVRETRRLLREASLNNDSFYNKLGRGLRDAFLDINTWDMGVNSVRNSATTLLAKNNLDKDKGTVSDNAVLESAALKNVTSQKTRDAISAWYNAGITTTNMIPFMAYIYSSPFNNIGKGLSSSISKMLTQNVEGALLQRMLPQVVYRASVNGLKGIGRFAGDVLGGSATALTFANQNILSDALNRYQGQHTGQFTPDGRFEYTGSQNAKGIGRSFAEAFATQAIEYQSELVGEYFTPLTRLLGKGFGKTVGYGTKEMSDAAGNKITSRFFGLPGHKISLDKTVDLFSRLTNKECWGAWNKFMKATKQNGVIGEYLEEVVGNMENATLGINNANWGTGEGGVFNPKENMETFLAVAVGTGFMSGLGGVAGAIHKGEISRAYNRANADGIKAFNLEAWQSIRDQIDNCPVPELPTIVVNLMEGMNDNQKRVIQNYAAFSVAKQGSLMADFKEQLEKPHIARVGTSVEISADGTERYFVKSMDEQNGLLSTKEFRSEEDANAYKARVEEYINNGRNVQVLNQLLSTDEGLKSAEQIAADMGEPISYISELFYLDPLKRTDTEQAIVEQFVLSANNLAFSPTDVNENHEIQNGQDIAEGTEIGDQQAIDTINLREQNAMAAWNEIDDPDLKSLVTSLTEGGSTPNQIVEWLRYYEYPEDVIAAFCELCNAKAEKEGYINRTGQKIEEQVAQQVKQNTFAGTFNGEGTPIILQVQDENGTPLYVVGGNISADEQGVLSSDSLVVLRDEQGNFIQRQDMNGLTLAGTYSVEDYTNSLLTQTQEAITAQIQSTEYKAPEYNDSDIESVAPETQQGNGLTVQQPAETTPPTQDQQPQTNTQQSPAIPLDENNNPVYHKSPIEATINDIYKDLEDDDARQFVQNNIDESSKEYEKISKKKPKIGTNKDAYLKAKEAWQQQVDEAKQKLDYWTSVKDYIQQQTKTTPEDIKAAQDELTGTNARLDFAKQTEQGATTPMEIAGEFVKNARIIPSDFYAETGMQAADARKQFPGMLSNNGVTIASLAEQLVQHDNDNYGGRFFKGDDMEARNYIIQALTGAESRKSLGRNMTAEEEEYVRQAEEQREDFHQEAYGMSYSDYLAFEEQEMPNIWRRISNFAPEQYDQMVAEYYESLPEDYFTQQNQNNNGTEQQNPTVAGSNEILPQPPTDNEGGSGQREDPAAETGNGSKGDNTNDEVPGGTQGVVTYDPQTKTWSGTPEGLIVVTNTMNGDGIIGFTDNPHIVLYYDTKHKVGFVRVYIENTQAETPEKIVAELEKQGYNIDSNGEYAAFIDFTNYEDAVKFDALVRQIDDKINKKEDDVNAEIKKDIEAFIAKSTHDVEITNYNEEDYEAQISVDGKPSNIVITPPMEYGESMHAEYRPTEGGYQELGDLLDEYNEGLEPKEQGFDGEHLAAIFSSVDAAINFETWLNQKNNPNDWENLTEEQKAAAIDADTIADENAKELAKDFLRGDNTSTIAEVFYREIVGRYMANEETPKKKEEKPSKPKPSNIPPTDQAESSKPKSKPKEDKPKTETPPATGDKSDVGKALDEFKDVMARFRKAGRTDANVSLIGLNARQIEMLGEVFRATAKLGYALIKSGTTTFGNWLEAMKLQVSDIIKANSNWNDQDIAELLTETWNNKYLADGVRKPLSQWAAEEALATEQKEEEQKQEEQKQEEEQPAETPETPAAEKRFPFTKQQLEGMTKQQMIDAMWHEVFPRVCEMYKLPSDILDENAYWFAPRMTTGYDKDSLVSACMKYMEHLYDEVQPATEKQMNYIMKLAAENEKKLFKDITLTRTAASRVIDLLKSEEEMIYSRSTKQDDFEEVYNELEKIARLNGADLSEKDRKMAERKFVDNLSAAFQAALETGEKPYASITALRKAAREAGMEVGENGETDIKIQELVEDALVSVARGIMRQARIPGQREIHKFRKETFEKIKLLYNLQPTISMRSSNRVALQQYSTPLPMAFCADMFANGRIMRMFYSAFEPTAGNGMLVFGIPSHRVHVNEIDENRLENLRGQGFKKVTSQDATMPFEGNEYYDAIITNPPFGEAAAKDYDGYQISGLAPQIALNALSKMRDFGRAVIIIGGEQKFASNGVVQNDKPFLAYLYDHYNVKGVIDMDGSLYAKQGTTYPTRMILIDGRRTAEERAKSNVYPPVQKNWIPKADSFDKLYDTVNELLNSKQKTNGTEIVRSKEQPLQSDRGIDETGDSNDGTDSRKPVPNVATGGKGHGPNGSTGKGSKRDSTSGVRQRSLFDRSGDLSDGEQTGDGRTTGGDNGRGGEGVDNRQPVDNTVSGVHGTAARGVGLTQKQEKRKLESEKLSYRPHNTAFSLESVAPAAMVEAMDKTLKRIEDEYGNIDEFVTNELGYDSVDAMHKALAAEQVDSVAMAIYNMKKGEALIIGDQTGVGKGRQMAALIRWAVKQGKKPVFMTQKSNLFNDIYRDLKDIGSENLKPFIFNNDKDAKISEITEDENGNEKEKIIYRSATEKDIADALKNGKVPDGYDFILCTYSQVSTGDSVSREYEDQLNSQETGDDNKKRSRSRRKPKPGAKPKKDTKATLLRTLAKDNYLMLDESHTAAGESNQGYYMQTLVRDSKAVTFASATYAKRPDTMPLYAMRTAMSKANIGMRELIGAIQKGGVTLQEIMSRALSDAGQMVRRERDMNGVVTDWTTIDDPETVKRARENYDKTIQAFNAIIDFQNTYFEAYLENQRESLAVVAGNAGYVRGTEKMGISNTPFASKTYNYTKQLMLALKVDAIVDEVERQIKEGKKPVIALDNTMGSMLTDLAVGEELEDSTFAASLLRGLESVMQYTQSDGMGGSFKIKIQPHELGAEGEAAYYQLVSFIKESTKNVFISPLDEIINKLRAKGYKVGELTGREKVVVEENGKYYVAKKGKTSKQLLQSRFNNNKLDVLILNKTGSTGISLHASKTFADQRQRVMILAQPLPDINDYMQMIGRIDRTGQVQRGYYINLGLPVPAEQRFLMMLSTKLKSLNANTTTSQDNKDNNVDAPDMLNKYGSQVIVEYFKDHPDIYNKLDDPLKVRNTEGGLSEYTTKPDDSDARKLTGYVALLSTEEQQAFYDDVVERYNALIKYLDDTGTNDLKITSLPLNAKTLAKAVSSKGTDPEGNNPFAKNAYCEMVEMDVLRKPMKADEVRKAMESVAKGKDPKQAVEDIKSQYESEYQERIDKQKRKYDSDIERNKETIAKFEEKINSNEKMSEEDKKKAIDDKKLTLQQETDRKNEQATKALNFDHERMMKNLDRYTVGESYLMPDNPDVMMFKLVSPAIFLGYKAKDKGITPSSTIAVFATLDGRRRVEIKLSEQNKLNNISEVTSQNYDAAQEVTLDNWDKNAPNQTRKTGYIMTGNILQAIKDTQDENGAFPGQLISYTDSEGNIHDGILMPDKWQPSMMINAGKPISEMMDTILNGNSVISINGEVEINVERSRAMGNAYILRVPKSKKTGQKYWENKELSQAINGKEYYQSAGMFQAYIPNGKLKDVLDALDKMGVKVASNITEELNSSADNTTRLAYSNSTNNVNNSRIIPEDVDKDVSLQIESEFDSAIESLNLTEGEKAELDKKIRDYSNSSTIELEDIFYINNSRLGLRNEKKDNFSEMLWRRGSAVSSPTTNAGGNIRNEKSGAEATASSNGEYSSMVSRRGEETEGANTARGNEVQGQYNGPRDIRNTGGDRLLLQEGRRIEEKVVSQTPRTELSSNQRRLLAAQYAISRELVYRDIRLAALKQSLGLQEGKPTSLDEIAAIFEKTNTDQQVNALFDRILAVNKRLGTSIEVAASDVNNNSGSAGTRRDVHYYLDGFTRTSAGKIQIPVVLAHELLHQGTIGAINLVRKGKAEGVLTKEQIDAVNTILDIYNKVKADSERLSESKRGLADPYEFAAQMVDPRQRKALSMSPLQRIMAAANELKAQGNNSLWNRIKNALKTLFGLSDLKKMDNAINTLLDTFNETVHDISMTDVDQNGWGYFIGEQGARNMDKAEEATIRLDNLKAARQFESMGKDPKTIKWATGWERGADGKWRYEIPDLTIKTDHKLNNENVLKKDFWSSFSYPIANLSDVVDAEELFKAYPKLKKINIAVDRSNGEHIAAFHPVYNTISLVPSVDIFEQITTPVENSDEIKKYTNERKKILNKLSDEEIEEYYNALDYFGGMTDDELSKNDAWVKFENKFPNVAEAIRLFIKEPEQKGGEVIGLRLLNNDYVREVLSHEIQHAIQQIEKFASGGNIDSFEKDKEYSKLNEERLKLEQSNEYLDAKNEANSAYEEVQKIRDRIFEIKAKPEYSIFDENKEEKELWEKLNEAQEKYDKAIDRYDKEAKRIHTQKKQLDEKIANYAYDYYKRISGEVESRNVQSRINMTPEERSRSLASETEDVARKDQIFIHENIGSSEMRSGELFDKYPTWLSGQTTGTGQHTTQITSTVNTYKKIGDWMKSQGMDGASVLDASSGLGKGTEALRDMGFNVEDVEPYPSENRTAPTYLKYEDIKGKYDVVISNAVLNVIPDDWRADVLKNMADKVKPGGKMIINVRDAKEMERQKQKIELDSPSEILVTDKAGNIRAYQKGFTQKELADWIQSELGEGWTIETAKPSNSGISGRAVVVTRNTETPLRYRKVEDSMLPRQTSQKQQERMRAKAESLAKSLNVPVKIITVDEAPNDAKGSKGYYNTRTGEVVIVLDNNSSILDIEQTIAHEVIGHKGLRGLLGKQNYYKLMNAIYDNLSEEDKKAIDEAARQNGWQLYTAIDEYLADQAEKMAWDARSATLWQNIVHYLTEALRNIGFIFKPNYKDARYWLWLSKNNLKRSDVMSNIRRNALLAKLDKLSRPEPTVKKDDVLGEPQYLHRDGNYVDSAAYDAIEENLRKKTFYWKEAFIDYMQAYQVFQEEMAKGLKNGLMDNQNALLGENALTSAIEQQQSDFLRLQLRPLQDLIKSLQDEFGSGQEGIRNIENYLMMKHGLERNRVLFMRDWYQAESERKIKSSGELSPEAEYIYERMEQAIWQDFDDGNIDEKERDKQLLIALNDAHQQYLSDTMSQFNRIKNDELENYELGIQSLAEAYQRIDDFINQHAAFDPNKHDMSGLTALKEYFSGSKYEDDKIIAEVESLDQKIGYEKASELMDAVQNVSQFALDQDYKNGLVTKEGYNRAKNMFRYYVPLRGFDDTTMEDVYGYMTYSKGTGAKSLVHANGRFSKAGSPLATASNMALNAIARGLRNQNKQRAYRLVNTWLKDNPDAKAPAIVADLWVGLDNNGNDIIHTPNITDDMSAEEIRDEIDRFNEEMKFLESQGKASKVKSEASFRHRFSSDNHKYEHIVPLMINGKAKMIVFNGNPRPAQALRGDLQPTVNKEFGMDRIMGQFNRIMAGAFTSYNPTFMMTNLLRDTGFANNTIAVKEGLEYYSKFTKNQAKLLTKGIGSYAKLKWNYDKGIAPRNKMEQYFYEFMRNGGKTGFVNQQDIAKLEKMLGAYNKQLSIPGQTIKVINALPQAIKAANERIENINRFAAYVTSRETGRSVMRSIYDAKEVSVNFNRKGAGGNTANTPNATFNMKLAANLASLAKNSYLFFNAGIQSLNMLSKNYRDHKVKLAAYAVGIPILLGGLVLPLLNQILAESFGDGDDDPYANLPEWTRRNNFCFYLGGGRFLKIPLPIELRAFYGLGDIAAGYLVNSNLKSEKNIALDMASQLSQILPVDFLGEGGSFTAAFTPDAIKPLRQIDTNTDWTGKPIYKDSEWNKYEPEYTKAFKGEFEPFVNLSKWINEVSGGSDHVKGNWDGPWNNPAIWHAVIQGYGGGAVMDAVRLGNLFKRVVTWDSKGFSTKEVPIIKAIFDTPSEKTQFYRMLNKFYNYREEAKRFEHDLKAYKESASPLDHAKYLNYVNTNKPSAEFRRLRIMKEYESIEGKINKVLKNPRLSEAEREAWEEQLTKLKVDAVKMLDQV